MVRTLAATGWHFICISPYECGEIFAKQDGEEQMDRQTLGLGLKNYAVYSESESSSELKHVCILHFYYTASVSIRILKLAYVCSVSYGNASFRLFRSVTNDCTAP